MSRCSPKTEYGIQEHGFAGYFAQSTEKRGANPRRRNGTVRCMFFPTAQQRGHSRERGRLCGKNGRKSAHQVRIFGSVSFWRLSRWDVCECINAFAPKRLWLRCFFILARRSGTAPILYCVKNDMLCSWNGNNSLSADCKYF